MLHLKDDEIVFPKEKDDFIVNDLFVKPGCVGSKTGFFGALPLPFYVVEVVIDHPGRIISIISASANNKLGYKRITQRGY